MKLNRCMFLTLALLAAVSCNKDGVSGKTGNVRFSVSSDEAVRESSKSNVSDYTTLPASTDFVLSIKGTDVNYAWSGKLSEWDSATVLAAGNYTAEASIGANDVEGFDKPYFNGSKDFTVKGGETSSVSIPASLANTIVKIGTTQMFRNYYPDYEFKLSRDNAEIATFAKDETRAAFVDGYKFTLSGVLKRELKETTFSKEYTNMEPKTCYNFTFDCNNAGGATLTITFNDNVATVDLGDLEIND